MTSGQDMDRRIETQRKWSLRNGSISPMMSLGMPSSVIKDAQ
jgi:hypothetical protein